LSHIVKIQTKVHDPKAVRQACQRLHLPAPKQGTVKLFSGKATGSVVQLPGWKYPIVADTLTGIIHYDNFEGAWGKQTELNRFLQAYAVEKARLEARRKGYVVRTRQLSDGSIRVQIQEGC
jgi:hypothetical protein